MSPSVLLRCALASSALVLGISACSGATGPPQPGPVVAAPAQNARTARSYFTPGAARNGLIYVADYTNSAIHIYPLAGKNQQQVGLIANTPIVEYLAVDRWRSLYVVEFVAGTVSVYPEGATSPSLVLTVEPKGAFPNAVAISQKGDVAVGQFAPNGIEFYRKRATMPFNTVTAPASFGSPGFCAFDASGNLYVIGSAASHASHIGEIVGGGKGHTIVDLGVNTGITNAKGIQVDTSGNVAVIGDDGTLNVYAPASNTLISTAQLLFPPDNGPDPNGGFSLVPSGNELYVASAFLNEQNLGVAVEYHYPAGGDIKNTIVVKPPMGGSNQTAVTGVAVSPPALR